MYRHPHRIRMRGAAQLHGAVFKYSIRAYMDIDANIPYIRINLHRAIP